MRPSSPSTESDADDRGSAPLEFILVGLVLLVPLVYLVVALGLIQQQSLGVEAAARHTVRIIAAADAAADADRAAGRVLSAVVDEYGLDADAVDVAITCRPAAASCPSAGATVVVTVTTRVTLPLVPPVLGLDRVASIPIEASAAHKVSRFWGNE